MRRQYQYHSVNENPGEGDAAGGIVNEPSGWGRPVQERNVRSRSGRGWGMRIDTFSVNQHVVVNDNGRFHLHGTIVSDNGWLYSYQVFIMDGSGSIRVYHHNDIRHAEDKAAGFGH